MNKNLLLECLRELLLDPRGTNMPKRKLLAEMIDGELFEGSKDFEFKHSLSVSNKSEVKE